MSDHIEEREAKGRGHYEEFGVESIPPDDDFALWATRKRFEQERKRLLANACGGCASCCEE